MKKFAVVVFVAIAAFQAFGSVKAATDILPGVSQMVQARHTAMNNF